MSGFLSDIASWALGGGAGAGANGQTTNDEQQAASASSTAAAVLSDDEMRAKRMARLAALENAQKAATESTGDAKEGGDSSSGPDASNSAVQLSDAPSSMDVDEPKKIDNNAHHQPMDVDENVKPPPSVVDTDVTMEESIPKKKIKTPTPSPTSASTTISAASALDPLAKLRRKKALLLRRVLLVTFGDSSSTTDTANANNCIHLPLDDDEMYNPTKSPSGVQPHHIAELLTARLSLSPKSHILERSIQQAKLGLIGYLGGCYKRACEEWRELKHEVGSSGAAGGGSSGKKKMKKEEEEGLEEMCAILEQIKDQVRLLIWGDVQLSNNQFYLTRNQFALFHRCFADRSSATLHHHSWYPISSN